MPSQDLQAISSNAKELHERLLNELIAQKVKRMSSEQLKLSQGLTALIDLHFWKETAEWAICVRLPTIETQAMASLERNIQQCRVCINKFGDTASFFAYVSQYISQISSNQEKL